MNRQHWKLRFWKSDLTYHWTGERKKLNYTSSNLFCDIREICKFTMSLGLLSTPNPSLNGIHKVMKFLLKLSMKCWNSVFNAQGSSRVIIVVAQIGAVKTYVAAAAVEALRKKERQVEPQFTTKIGGKTSLGPVISLCKILVLSYTFDAILCRNWPFSVPICGTFPITLLHNTLLHAKWANIIIGKPWPSAIFLPCLQDLLFMHSNYLLFTNVSASNSWFHDV